MFAEITFTIADLHWSVGDGIPTTAGQNGASAVSVAKLPCSYFSSRKCIYIYSIYTRV